MVNYDITGEESVEYQLLKKIEDSQGSLTFAQATVLTMRGYTETKGDRIYITDKGRKLLERVEPTK